MIDNKASATHTVIEVCGRDRLGFLNKIAWTMTQQGLQILSDIIGDSHSSIFDVPLTQVMDGRMAKLVAWYDNEWGYSNKVVEMINVIGG